MSGNMSNSDPLDYLFDCEQGSDFEFGADSTTSLGEKKNPSRKAEANEAASGKALTLPPLPLSTSIAGGEGAFAPSSSTVAELVAATGSTADLHHPSPSPAYSTNFANSLNELAEWTVVDNDTAFPPSFDTTGPFSPHLGEGIASVLDNVRGELNNTATGAADVSHSISYAEDEAIATILAMTEDDGEARETSADQTTKAPAIESSARTGLSVGESEGAEPSHILPETGFTSFPEDDLELAQRISEPVNAIDSFTAAGLFLPNTMPSVNPHPRLPVPRAPTRMPTSRPPTMQPTSRVPTADRSRGQSQPLPYHAVPGSYHWRRTASGPIMTREILYYPYTGNIPSHAQQNPTYLTLSAGVGYLGDIESDSFSTFPPGIPRDYLMNDNGSYARHTATRRPNDPYVNNMGPPLRNAGDSHNANWYGAGYDLQPVAAEGRRWRSQQSATQLEHKRKAPHAPDGLPYATNGGTDGMLLNRPLKPCNKKSRRE